jgi:hypothetical protein
MNEVTIMFNEAICCSNFSALTVVLCLITETVTSLSFDKSRVDKIDSRVSSVKTRILSHVHSSTVKSQ